MVIRTFIDKSATIVRDSDSNFGLYPVVGICYGPTVARALLHFDLDKIRDEFGGKRTVKHILKMTNCGSLVKSEPKEGVSVFADGFAERASSFDIIAFRIPQEWDEGVGFDGDTDLFLSGKKVVSKDGATWYQSYNGNPWNEDGVYSNETLSMAVNAYNNSGDTSVIVARQHFDHGNENLQIDLTDYINELLDDDRVHNFGIGLAFSPYTETFSPERTQYVGFFSNETNTMFAPVVESRDDDALKDNRDDFVRGRENSLCLYVSDGGEPVDLDELPKCHIDGSEYPVTRVRRGVYSAAVNIDGGPEGDVILYDVWSGLKLGAVDLQDVEMEFVAHGKGAGASLGRNGGSSEGFEPIVSGIREYERIQQGELRNVNIILRVPYEKDKVTSAASVKYRIYTIDGKNDVDVIDWDVTDTLPGQKYEFSVRTAELLPGNYHVDIIVLKGAERRIFRNKLSFTVIGNATYRKL